MNDDLTVQIERRAYFLWEKENRPEGRHLEHWLCAKAEIETEQSPTATEPNHPAADRPSEAVVEPVEPAGSAPEAAEAKRRTG